MTALQKISQEAKRIYKANPNLSWKECIKKASLLYSKKKKNAIVKSVKSLPSKAKKVAVKKVKSGIKNLAKKVYDSKLLSGIKKPIAKKSAPVKPIIKKRIESKSDFAMAGIGETRYKLKGSNFGQQIENGKIFKDLINKAYNSQSSEKKYDENFIREIAFTGNIVKYNGSYYAKDYMYKGTVSKFGFLDNPYFIEALKYIDRPPIKKMSGTDTKKAVGYKEDRIWQLKKATPYIRKYKAKGYSRKDAIKQANIDSTFMSGTKTHKDTKSHNVNIRVMSGVKHKNLPPVKTKTIVLMQSDYNDALYKLERWTALLNDYKMDYKLEKDPIWKKFYKNEINKISKVVSELKIHLKNIK